MASKKKNTKTKKIESKRIEGIDQRKSLTTSKTNSGPNALVTIGNCQFQRWEVMDLASRNFITKNELRNAFGLGDFPEEIESEEVIDSRRLLDGSCETLFADGSRIIVPVEKKTLKGFSDLSNPWNTIDFSSPIVPVDEDSIGAQPNENQPTLFDDVQEAPLDEAPTLFAKANIV